LRVAGLASGSGKTLRSALELQRILDATTGGSPFEVVALFSDSNGAECLAWAEEEGLPSFCLDIRDYYSDRGVPLKDMRARADYDREVLRLLQGCAPDMLLLAGYVWAVTDVVTGSIMTVGVHPADLAIQKDGHRAYAGADGVGATLAGGEGEIRASSYLATPVLDGGPILIVSPPVKIEADEGMGERDRFRKYLSLVNEQSREAGARTLLEIARGRFSVDADSVAIHDGRRLPGGLRFESWPPLLPDVSLFSPRSVAVVGASASGQSLGGAVLNNIVSYGFKGEVYPVNRRGEDLLGLKGYSSVLDIPGEVDLAVITVPGAAAVEVAEQCGRKGVKNLATLSAGFREVGGDGLAAEEALMDSVRRFSMRMIGPNCMGLLNTSPSVRLHANMLQTAPTSGGVGLITQSGAIGAALLDFAPSLGIGFSLVASTGNQPDMTINDLLPLYLEDENTRTILAYIETIPDPGRFVRVLTEVASRKPVIIVKAGATEAGAAAALSHTGSLAGKSRIASALLERTGAIVVQNLEEAFLLASALSTQPRVAGNRVAVVNNAGGPGTLVADELSRRGFSLPALPEATRLRLAQELLPQASTGNPLDLVATARPEHYLAAARAVAKSGGYDAIAVVVVPPAGVDTGAAAEAMIPALKSSGLPVVTCFFGPTMGDGGRSVMQREGFPSFPFPEQTASVLSLMRGGAAGRAASPFIPRATSLERRAELRRKVAALPAGFLPPNLCEEILLSYGFPLPHSFFMTSPDDAAPPEARYPMVAKIDHPEVLHKSDAGGVVLGILDRESLGERVHDLLSRFPGACGVLVQEQVPGGFELILGADSDPLLGHAVLVGRGGTDVEVYSDVALGHVPFSRDDGLRLLERLKCLPILRGHRGRPGVDLEQLSALMEKLQRLLLDLPEIEEMDLNPLIWDGVRFTAADYRIRTRG
jgi:acetyltransferase